MISHVNDAIELTYRFTGARRNWLRTLSRSFGSAISSGVTPHV